MIPLKDNIPSRHFPIVNTSIIIICIFVFLFEVSQKSELNTLIYTYAFIPNLFFLHFSTLDSIKRCLCYMFIHGGFLHILGNVWFLYIFGDNVEDRMGHLQYLLFYLLGGIFSAIFQGSFSPSSTVPLIGASGAISAVLAAYLCFFPHARILTLVFIFLFVTLVNIPAVVFIIFWFLIQFLYGFASIAASVKGGIAYFAHIGGFIFGIAWVKYVLGKRKWA
ncbi:MAG: rhomboid family intramembrane serine protease [Deltaproteobacteria bacterium]|nr:rhomboid family intramembrane serine protease [Deltaproteobacteria bacterium]